MAYRSPLLRSLIKDVLRPTIKASAGMEVVYTSIATGGTYTVIASFDNTGAEVETDSGFAMSEKYKDFKIDKADLPVIPQYRDTITWESEPGNVQWFQVLEFNGSRLAEPNDNFEIAWVLHTKRIPTPTPTMQAYGTPNDDEAYGTLDDDAYGGPI